MPAPLRRLLLVLLMLALPLQGVAAAAMRLCEAMHGSGAGSSYVLEAQAGHPASAIAEAAAVPRATHDCHPAGAENSAGIDDDADAVAEPGSCSACAVCGLTAMPVATVLDLGHPTLTGVKAGATVVPVDGPTPDRLERPPRAA